MSNIKSTVQTELVSLVRGWKNENISRPCWQRNPDAWNKAQISSWRETLRNRCLSGEEEFLLGTIVLHSLKDDEHKRTFICDGLQRVHNSAELYEDWVKEFGKDEAETRFSRVKVNVQRVEFENEQEAVAEFELLNKGTALCPEDIGRTEFSILKPMHIWENLVLNPIHEAVGRAEISVGFRLGRDSTRARHSPRREDYSLFSRFLVSTNNFKDNISFEGKALEHRLTKQLLDLGLDTSAKRVQDFDKYLTDQSVFLKEIWRGIYGENKHPTGACLRWCLHIAFCRRDQKIPLENYKGFMRKLLKVADGQSRLETSSKDTTTKTLKRGQVSQAELFSKYLDLEESERIWDKDIQSRHTPTTYPKTDVGYEDHHPAPFSIVGNGPTVPITAVENRSLGNKV